MGVCVQAVAIGSPWAFYLQVSASLDALVCKKREDHGNAEQEYTDIHEKGGMFLFHLASVPCSAFVCNKKGCDGWYRFFMYRLERMCPFPRNLSVI